MSLSASMDDYRPDSEVGFTAIRPAQPMAPGVDPAAAEFARAEFERQELERRKVLAHMIITRLVDYLVEPNQINIDLAKAHMEAM